MCLLCGDLFEGLKDAKQCLVIGSNERHVHAPGGRRERVSSDQSLENSVQAFLHLQEKHAIEKSWE